MRFNYKKFKYMYSLTAIAIASFFIFAIASPVSAMTYINPGLVWNGADMRAFFRVSGQENAYNINQGTEPYSREEFNISLGNPLRAVIFNLYNPVFEIDQPILVFMISGISVNDYVSNGRIPLCYAENGNGTTFRREILDYKLDSHDNDHVYIYNLGDGGFMLFFPLDYFYIRPSGGSISGAEFINLTILSPNTSTAILNSHGNLAQVAIQYIGAVDLNDVNYTSILEAILNSSSNINTKLDTVINLLNNQQSQQQASQSINSAETVHNNIDQIQNSSGTALSNGFNSFLNNPDLTLNTSTISGASFLATLATSIFNNVGIFNWLFIFPAFIGLGTYLIGRGSKVLK